MNILHTEFLMHWGGEQNKVINEMLCMRELGHNVILFCNPGSVIAKRADELGFQVVCEKMTKKTYFSSIPSIIKFIKNNNINLVIAHGAVDSWVCAIAGIILRSKGIKFVRERHNLFPIRRFYSRFMHANLFDKILYVSRYVYEYLLEIGVKENKLVHIPSVVRVNDLADEISSLRAEIKTPLSVGTFTSLYNKKGVYELAYAAKDLIGELGCTFVFGGDISDSVRNEVVEILGDKAKNAIFTGFRNDKANVIKASDIFIFASHSEGLPNALLEAMATQRPIVVFDLAPMNDLIKNEERGLCAACFDPKSLVECVLRFVNDPKLAQSCARNSYNFVLENYDIDVLKKYIKEFLDSKL